MIRTKGRQPQKLTALFVLNSGTKKLFTHRDYFQFVLLLLLQNM